jgi:hypothetical protein
MTIPAAPCRCPECLALDRAHPREGRQLALAISSGERPVSLPLPDPDAPAVPAAGVSAPMAAQSRRMRSRPQPENSPS